ncbi:hypothetical protein C8N36_101444 [Pelagimonas varians]|uniref:Uncharacterized protein n=1 Tax=Pelagimonas varians TaxID=696760 RepID=A0A238JP44_9RHOB|nr:hypothetical protein C8N36_101444 [Pelagimonas varians]SMX32421.1 hypothetical protein PEV8663_00023 [Pelagimonas varians]
MLRMPPKEPRLATNLFDSRLNNTLRAARSKFAQDANLPNLTGLSVLLLQPNVRRSLYDWP